MNLNYKDYLELIGALVTSIGGASVVIIAISKWFGDFLAKTLFEKYRTTKEIELEGLKVSYQTELENTKANLEKAKLSYLRYSEGQYKLYNELWKVLLYTKNQADVLWERASKERIPAFSEQIRNAKNAINDNMLLIEEEHYENLMKLINQFEQFQFGKKKLVDMSLRTEDNSPLGISEFDVNQVIQSNK
ncbi:MAG: hypothetical protein P4L35_00215 [Ignavibacteriaceae bacterium]|nr:hypothetical protein [Ignavibacteriaceae bacterium]